MGELPLLLPWVFFAVLAMGLSHQQQSLQISSTPIGQPLYQVIDKDNPIIFNSFYESANDALVFNSPNGFAFSNQTLSKIKNSQFQGHQEQKVTHPPIKFSKDIRSNHDYGSLNKTNKKPLLNVCPNTAGEFLKRKYDQSSFRHSIAQYCHQSSENINLRNTNIQQTITNSQLNTTQSMFISLSILIAISAVIWVHRNLRKHKIALINQLLRSQTQKQQLLSIHLKQIEAIKQKNNFYQVYWDRLVDQVHDKKCYDHLVYEGRFLTQQTYVYVVKIEGTDIATLERKLNKLLTCSHSRLSKLYFYTKTDQYLLVFTEKLNSLAGRSLPEYLNINVLQSAKRNAIIEIIQTVDYLQAKIQLKWLPLHSIELQYNIIKKEYGSYEFKINAIPCLFRRMPDSCGDQQVDTCSQQVPCFVRYNIAALFHLILMNGKSLSPFKGKLSHLGGQPLVEEYQQFLNFILYQARAIGHTHDLLFRQMKDHPFLWQTKRKILFLSDFSNYIETHLDDYKVQKLQEYARYYDVVETNWSRPLHFLFAQEINNYRKYDFESVRDLVRMIRNKINHFHQMPKQIRAHVGKTPEKFVEYCLDKFPKLLYFAYNYTRKKKWKLHMK